ncbi:Uu.00g078160.m01.CDS01 [Anthostomella pinea]|uniref:Uu.00g078160.m01.CDS01 n=1 Tax=Anthostomella pinea TaxID=933095 RepID=A0AAI8YJ37_9PEZI|nr:Uu.00g078160.m01.CDS01 [Anthostomella pinea]
MSTPHHLQIINPDHSQSDEAAWFPRFALLPTELRHQIWKNSLEHQRLLKVELETRLDDEALGTPRHPRASQVSQPVRGGGYHLVRTSHQAYGELLRVNVESWEVALRFYRVQIPYWYSNPTGHVERERGIFYFNPEYDILQLEWFDPMCLVEFLYDLKTYDPKGIGLLNLALDIDDLDSHDLDLPQQSGQEAAVMDACKDTISQLREINWVANSYSGRQVTGMINDFPHVKKGESNHSCPIMPVTVSFDRMCRDPRPIAPDLHQVLASMVDPIFVRMLWRTFLRELDIRPAQPASQRFMVACMPISHETAIVDVETADELLDVEDEQWRQAQKQWPNMGLEVAGQDPVEELESAVRPAVGFWLLPMDLYQLIEAPSDSQPSNLVFDATNHWPELGLAILP